MLKCQHLSFNLSNNKSLQKKEKEEGVQNLKEVKLECNIVHFYPRVSSVFSVSSVVSVFSVASLVSACSVPLLPGGLAEVGEEGGVGGRLGGGGQGGPLGQGGSRRAFYRQMIKKR